MISIQWKIFVAVTCNFMSSVLAFHVVVAYVLSIVRETDRLMNHTNQPAHLMYSNSHQHSLKHDLDIMI